MRRILIVGCPGSGKSTLARRLAAQTGLPIVHLDKLYWRKGWVEPDRPTWEAQVATVIAEPAWIIDGHYGNTLKQRLAAADGVVFLDLPRWLCVLRTLRRTVFGFGRARTDLAEGCPERFDLKFLVYVWRYRQDKRPKLAEELRRFSGRLIVLRQSAEVEQWLTSGEVDSPELPRVPA